MPTREKIEAHWDAVEERVNDALRRPHFTPDDDGYWGSRAELEYERRSRAENDREVARNERCYGDL